MKYEIIISDMCSLWLFADDFIINEGNNTLEFFVHRCLDKDRIAYFNQNNIVGFYETQENMFKKMFEDEQKVEIEVYEDEKTV